MHIFVQLDTESVHINVLQVQIPVLQRPMEDPVALPHRGRQRQDQLRHCGRHMSTPFFWYAQHGKGRVRIAERPQSMLRD